MMITPRSVLVVDDEPGVLIGLSTCFREAGWQVDTAEGVMEAIERFSKKPSTIVISDVRMPDGTGLSVMRRIRRIAPETPIILLTAYASVPEAVEAIQGGACDYLTKPVEFHKLQAMVDRLLKQSSRTKDWPRSRSNDLMVGDSPEFLRCVERATNAARSEADILIEAESGTGKEVLARYIHALSARSMGAFVAVNCAAVPADLLESELFGHVKGAFTGATIDKPGRFQQAHRGTLLLDEIGEMPLLLQPKLLRAIQEREYQRIGDTKTTRVDIRIIATTNVGLEAMVAEGRFRSDLYYRLNVIPISIPPLRERVEDIESLAMHFVESYARRSGHPAPSIEPGFLQGLKQHSWPGNVRELGNFITRVLALSGGGPIDAAYLSSEFLCSSYRPAKARRRIGNGSSLKEIEKSVLESTLEMTQGNRTHAAEMLGVSLRTVRNKIRAYGLPPRSSFANV